MANNSYGQNNPLTYMDGVSVKISENYKPPKRIATVMSYSQRVTYNKLIQEPTLTYDFSIEERIKNKMYEWHKARASIIEQRKQRLNQLTQAINNKTWETNDNAPNNEVLEGSDPVNTESTSDSSVHNQDNDLKNISDSKITSTDPYYQTESGILIPKIFSWQQQCKILTPTLLTSSQLRSDSESCDIKNYTLSKNPFNFSEFESDTSSPFDNMELKTINDLEELAQVLKYDSDVNVTSNSLDASQSKNINATCPKTQNKPANNVYVSDNMFSKQNNHATAYALEHSANTKKLPVNGYYYDSYSHSASSHHDMLTTQMTSRESPIRSVPEIMKSLEADLASNHIDSSIGKKTASVEVVSVPKTTTHEILENPFESLEPELQKMAIEISYMGFPLPRVARASRLLEGNKKKIVEHLLAMSELLDLGFTEQKVVDALVKCENDRDKALDFLIK